MAKLLQRERFSREDLKVLAVVAVTYAATSLWPRRWDGALLKWRAALSFRLRTEKLARMAALMRSVLGPAAAGRDLLADAREHYRMCQETGWIRIRNMHAKKSEEHIEIDGLQHIHQALAAGHGVILWGMQFAGYTVQKAALSRAGIRVSHLSRENHAAPSQSWLGLEVAAPLFRKAETSFLERRVVIPSDGSLGYMRELMQLLEQNSCISISGELTGKQNVQTNFFGWREDFATGAPALAYKMKSTLLTCYAIREGNLKYRLVIQPPIAVDHSLDRHEFSKRAVEEFALRVQQAVSASPANWDRWDDRDIRDRLPATQAPASQNYLNSAGTAVPLATSTKANH